MKPTPKKTEQSVRLQLVVPPSWLAEVEEWRAKQRPVPNVSAAIRRLVTLGLGTES